MLGKLDAAADGKGDEAIKCLLDADTLTRSTHVPFVKTMSLRPALYALVGRICSPHFRKTDKLLWNHLMDLVESYSRDDSRFASSALRLHLLHPVTPDPRLALSMLRVLSESPLESYLFPSDRAKADLLKYILAQAIRVLVAQENQSEAAWVAVLGRQHLSGDRLSVVEDAFTLPPTFRKQFPRPVSSRPATDQDKQQPEEV